MICIFTMVQKLLLKLSVQQTAQFFQTLKNNDIEKFSNNKNKIQQMKVFKGGRGVMKGFRGGRGGFRGGRGAFRGGFRSVNTVELTSSERLGRKSVFFMGGRRGGHGGSHLFERGGFRGFRGGRGGGFRGESHIDLTEGTVVQTAIENQVNQGGMFFGRGGFMGGRGAFRLNDMNAVDQREMFFGRRRGGRGGMRGGRGGGFFRGSDIDLSGNSNQSEMFFGGRGGFRGGFRGGRGSYRNSGF